MGIEPTWPAWKAGALPLSYTRSVENTNPAGRFVNAQMFTCLRTTASVPSAKHFSASASASLCKLLLTNVLRSALALAMRQTKLES